MSEHEDLEHVACVDPRDHLLGDFLYSDPEPIDVNRMVSCDFCWMDAALEQLLICEMIDLGWLFENSDDSIGLTDLGRSFAQQRLEKKVWWSDHMIRPDAPPLPEMSNRLKIAYEASVLRYPDNRLWQKVKAELFDAQTH